MYRVNYGSKSIIVERWKGCVINCVTSPFIGMYKTYLFTPLISDLQVKGPRNIITIPAWLQEYSCIIVMTVVKLNKRLF